MISESWVPCACQNVTWRCGCGSLAEASLEETVAHFTAALLVYCKSVTEQSVALMEQECRDISAFFSRYCKPDKVGRQARACLRRLSSPDSHAAQVWVHIQSSCQQSALQHCGISYL